MVNHRKIRMEEYNYNDENCNNSSFITQSCSEDSHHTTSTSSSKRKSRRRGNRRQHRPLQVRPAPQSSTHYHHPQHNHSLLKIPSKKVHDAPMKRRDMYFAIDCEMVGIGPGGIDSALARVSIVNFEKDIVLDTYVKVDEPVTDYRTFVSGIKPEHIESKSAMPLAKVQFLVSKILHGKILVGHGLENDLKVIGIQHPWCDTRDTAKYGPFMRTIEKENTETVRCPKRLRDLVFEKFGKEIQVAGKSHCPVEDAVAAMDLYKAVRNEWEMHMREEVNKAASQRSLSPLQDTREPVEPLRQRNMSVTPPSRVQPRTLYYPHSPSGDAGGQLLFQSPHQHQHPHPQHGHPMPQFVTPVQPHQPHPYMSMPSSPQGIMPYEYQMNATQYSPSNRRSRVADARRAKELAKAKVVAALHQQRVMWQQKKQQEMDQQRPVYVEQRVSV